MSLIFIWIWKFSPNQSIIFFTWAMIAICRYPVSILLRHFIQVSTPVEYEIRYGNASSIFWSCLYVHHKKSETIVHHKIIHEFSMFWHIKILNHNVVIGVLRSLDNWVHVLVEMLSYTKHLSIAFIHKHALTYNALYSIYYDLL